MSAPAENRHPFADLLLGGTLSALALVIGLVARNLRFIELLDDAGRLSHLLFSTANRGLIQVGALGILTAILMAGWRVIAMVRGREPRPMRIALVVKVCIPLIVALVTGEVFLRLTYWDGLSFGRHRGPMVRRFERDFEFNRFDGPSRGPDTIGRNSRDAIRILVQGDSITWGQGVKEEDRLYTNRLLSRFQQDCSTVEMAVLAKAGREIDGHLEQLVKWGHEIRPDIIVYQWYINDMELDKRGRPSKGSNPPWRRLFFHYLLAEYSYLWFFVDDRLASIWPSGSGSYAAYMIQGYARGTPGWQEFERLFREWAEEARRLTPSVLVALYPHDPGSESAFAVIYEQMVELCRDAGIDTFHLSEAFSEYRDDFSPLTSSRFDGHPGALAHQLMADGLYDHMTDHPRYAVCVNEDEIPAGE